MTSSFFIGMYWIINKKSLERINLEQGNLHLCDIDSNNNSLQKSHIAGTTIRITTTCNHEQNLNANLSSEEPNFEFSNSASETRQITTSKNPVNLPNYQQALPRSPVPQVPHTNGINRHIMTSSPSPSKNNYTINSDPTLKYQFLKSRLWWFGIISMALGELANFTAYMYSPASLVTPLGALSVVVTCILSVYFLDEKLNLFCKLGVILAVLGSIFIVLHAPKSKQINSLDELYINYISQPAFVGYACIVVTMMMCLSLVQNEHYFYKLLLSSLAGGFCVISTKCLGIVVTEIHTLGIFSVLSNWLFYAIVLLMASSISLQIVQITRALNQQPASTVMPIFYITFTISVVLGMNVLFQEYKDMKETTQILSIFIGFLTLCCAVFLLQGFKELPICNINDIEKFKNVCLYRTDDNFENVHNSNNLNNFSQSHQKNPQSNQNHQNPNPQNDAFQNSSNHVELKNKVTSGESMLHLYDNVQI